LWHGKIKSRGVGSGQIGRGGKHGEMGKIGGITCYLKPET